MPVSFSSSRGEALGSSTARGDALTRRLRLLAPGLLFFLIVFYVFSRDAGQIEALLLAVEHPQEYAQIVALAAAFSAALLLLRRNGGGAARVVDVVVFLLPPVCVVAALYLKGSAGLAATLVSLVAVVAAGVWLSRYALPSGKASLAVLAGALLAFAAMRYAILLSPVQFPRRMGAISLALVFSGLIAVCLQLALRHLVIGSLALLAAIAAFVSFQERHVIPSVDQTVYNDFDEAERVSVRRFVSLRQTFRTWLQSRNDLGAYLAAGKPYPVFVVASEGGGGYAAAHADLFLSKLRQRCPNFPQHLFALIGVSGGAVGNALFHAALPDDANLSQARGCQGQTEATEVLAKLGKDHLSPVLAALLFQDFPNKLLMGALGDYDRSAALGRSLSDAAWADGGAARRLYWSHFWDQAEGSAELTMGEKPALVLVATNAVSGKRYVFAPFRFPYNGYRERYEEFLDDMNWTGSDEVGPRQSDVNLIDAVVASASFPWLTPSRVLEGRQLERISLVDGGYLDNSGAETARDIVDGLTARESDPNTVELDTIRGPRSQAGSIPALEGCRTVELAYVPPAGSLAESERLDQGPAGERCVIRFSIHAVVIRSEVPYLRSAARQSFLLDPVTALLSARSRRAETARFGLLSQLCGGLECPEADFLSTWRFYESVIATDSLTLPLGWYLPVPRLQGLDRFVAPEPGEDFGLAELPQGGMAPIIDGQLRTFGGMGGNPANMQAIFAALDPQG